MSHKKTTVTRIPAIALLATLLSALPGWSAESVSADGRRPSLVLGIMVDGLQTDCLDLLANCFGPDGFNRLRQGGLNIDELDYGPGIDAAGAIAMIYTGAPPTVSGIATAQVYSTDRRMELPALLDPEQIGNYTDETLSPRALLVSTLADETRIDGAGASYAHAIAADPSAAIIMGGHAGNSAFWINNANGQWATTTHYREVPTAVTARNYTGPLSLRIDTAQWTPSLPLDRYPGLPEHKRHYPFRHTFSGLGAAKYKAYKASPLMNGEVTDLAIEYIEQMKLGQRPEAMDMLSVAYSLKPYPHSSDLGARLETMDAYVKLDRQIARLLRAVGKDEETVIFLAGTPSAPSGDADDPQWLLPGGEFSARKAMSLLNMYLMARLGNGDWVTAYNRGAFYLNHKLIEQKQLDAEEVRTDAAKFLTRMSGVAGATTIDDILEGRTSDARRRNTVVASSADIFIDIQPGWTLTDDTYSPSESHVVRLAHASAPAILYAPTRIAAGTIATPVDARRIAPTVARLLRIRSPNAASLPPLSH